MPYKVIFQSGKRTISSDHRLKKNALEFKESLKKAKKSGKIPKTTGIMLVKVKKLKRSK